MNLKGKLTVDEDGIICMEMQLSPQNPEIYDIPLEELMEEYIGKRVSIDVLPLKHISEVNDK